jgi:hypothetical protein
MLLAIENYRGGLIWSLADSNNIIKAGLDAIFA